MFDWEKAFEDCNPTKQNNILTDTVFRIKSNYIPHDTSLIDNRDPLWINKHTKDLIYEKNLVYQRYLE